MSRTRIVRGKITEIVGGDLTYFSESSISEYAAEVYSENSKTVIKHSDNPEKPPAGEIKAKCLVKFRPHDKYDGEYGFDWLREGDSGQKGDNWFGGIMGKYYEADNVTVFKNTNSWNNNFRKDMKMYDRKLKSYKSFSLTWKKVGKSSYLYPIPTLTLLKSKTATFNLKIEIQEKPEKLTFEFKDQEAEKYLTLNIKEIGDIRKGKYDKFNYFKITCKESFSKEQMLYVKADGEICGAIQIHANSTSFRKNINVAIINVTTDVNGTEVTGAPISGGLDFFKKCLNQALVIPNVKEEKSDLDCTGNLLYNTFRSKFCTQGSLHSGGNGYRVTNSTGLREYLEKECKRQFGSKYNGYIKLFFIGEEGSWNGFSFFNSDFGVYFKGHNRGTVAHETFHALNLPHTFDGINGKYTYQAGQTNNIMDYSHQSRFGSIDRKVVYLWQWNILNPKIKR